MVGIGAVIGAAPDAARWASVLAAGESLVTGGQARTEGVDLALRGLRFPPKDLQETLPQQLLVLAATREAVERLPVSLPRERTAVLIGMEADPEIARYGMRWRLAEWGRQWSSAEAPTWLAAAREGVVPELHSAGVVGTMPNIPANRLNSQLDVAGPSFVLAAGERGGLLALELASRALRAGELDAAVVGAVDLSCEPVHRAAVAALLPPDRQVPGDAVVVLVLQRKADAEAAGLPILAVLPSEGLAEPDMILGTDPGCHNLAATHGHAHAAAGMVHLGATVLALATGSRPDGGTGAAASARVRVGGHTVDLRAPDHPVDLRAPVATGPLLHLEAHWPPLTLPPLPAAPAVRAHPAEVAMAAISPSPGSAQQMAPAPTLPPILGTSPVDPTPPYTAHATPSRTVQSPVHRPEEGARHSPGQGPGTAPGYGSPVPLGASAVIASHAASVRVLHEQYLESQAQTHARFLQVRQHAMMALLQRGGQAGGALLPGPLPTAAAVHATPATAAPMVDAAPMADAAPIAGPVGAPPPVKAPAPPRITSTPTQAPASPWPASRPAPTGPTLDRDRLKVHASGKISDIYGPQFGQQDGYARQCRMPEPPLLLADRMTGLQAEPGSMAKGTIWTETDVRTDSWYLNEGRMPSGIMIESGQADLMLISYLGIDLAEQGPSRLSTAGMPAHLPPGPADPRRHLGVRHPRRRPCQAR